MTIPISAAHCSSIKDPADARRILAIDPKLRTFWFRGEGGSAISETEVVRAASARGDGWETVASVGNRPLVLRRPLGKGMVYVYLGRWVWRGADALRSVLAYAGRQAAPLAFDKPDDRLEYVAYRKNRGAWVALFNHGNIVVGCDRLDPAKWRVAPPEPLCTMPRGPYRGTIEFRLDRLDLDPSVDYACYQVLGIDGQALDGVVSGRKTFEVKEIPFESRGGVIRPSHTPNFGATSRVRLPTARNLATRRLGRERVLSQSLKSRRTRTTSAWPTWRSSMMISRQLSSSASYVSNRSMTTPFFRWQYLAAASLQFSGRPSIRSSRVWATAYRPNTLA